jgi:hypothetical protein
VCGGDCYARGHIRLPGQALEVEVHPLVETFDRQHAATDPLEEAEVDDWSPLKRSRRPAPLLALCVALLVAAPAVLLAVLR